MFQTLATTHRFAVNALTLTVVQKYYPITEKPFPAPVCCEGPLSGTKHTMAVLTAQTQSAHEENK